MTRNRPVSLCFIRRHFSLYGGAERYLSRLIETLGERYERHVIAENWEETPGVILHCVSKNHTQSVKYFAISAGEIIAQNKFDIIFSLERTLGQDIYRAGDGVHREWLNMKRKYLRGNWAKELLNSKNSQILSLEERLFATTPHIIANSQMVKQQIIQHYSVPESRINVIYNGVTLPDTSLRSEMRQKLLNTMGLSPSIPIFSYVGSGFERKGVALLLQGLSLVEGDRHAFIVGKGNIRHYQKIASRLGILSRVTFTGPVSDPTPYYAAANLFVLPTYYDPFSNTCLEAASWGTAVVTSRNNGASELLSHAGVINTFTPDELAGNIRPFLQHAHAETCGAYARTIAEQFSIENNVAQTVAVIEKAFSQKFTQEKH